MPSLSQEQCVPCRGGEPTLDQFEIEELRPKVPEWEVLEVEGEKRLRRAFRFKNFQQALDFTNAVGAAA
ncbi:MAG: 4a-hydroxytetrahydrobiopterin dehydratase, partial [Chloroflexi bacterium]